MDLRQLILGWVAENPGIKATQLAVDVVTGKYVLDDNDVSGWVEVVNQLVADGELIEIEYIDPRMDYRAKSIYFPKKTKLRIITGDSDFEFVIGNV